MDMVLVMLRARIARLTQLPILGFEDSQMLHYAPGEEFKPHFDFLDTREPGHAAAVASGGQRVLTFLIYLNEGYDGGETAFPQLGWRYKADGRRIAFYNATEAPPTGARSTPARQPHAERNTCSLNGFASGWVEPFHHLDPTSILGIWPQIPLLT
jgi:hypothetical protein